MEDTVTGIQLERLEAAARQLAEDGYAVVPGVLSAHDCSYLYAGLWAAVESLTSEQATPVRRSDPATHRGDAFPRQIKGIIEEPPALSHCEAVWEARKAAAPYFARLHGTPALASSFDRVNMMPAPTREPVPRNWMHTDQTPLLNGLHSIQGFIDLRGTGPNDGGLVVAVKSHKQHHALLYGQWGIEEGANWVKFDDAQRAYIDEHFEVVKVECAPGSLVLWDSRTFHQNTPPKMGGHERCVIYTSFQPLTCVPSDRLDKILARRLKAFKELRSASHVALSHFKMFGKSARTYGAPPRKYHIDARALGVPVLAKDPVVASLVGASRAPAVRWDAPHAALLKEPMLPPGLMIAGKKRMLEALADDDAQERPRKRARLISKDDDDDDD
jgi:hypothetical protein